MDKLFAPYVVTLPYTVRLFVKTFAAVSAYDAVVANELLTACKT